jgi:hypothetical protein
MAVLQYIYIPKRNDYKFRRFNVISSANIFCSDLNTQQNFKYNAIGVYVAHQLGSMLLINWDLCCSSIGIYVAHQLRSMLLN